MIVTVNSHDELGTLALTFNFMTNKLKQTMEGLRKSEQFLGDIVENIPNMIFVKDAETLRFVRFNKAGEKLLGYTRKELVGKSVSEVFPTNQADFFLAKDREVIRSKCILDIPEETVQTKSGGERILHTKKMPILDKEGNPQFLLGISEDITAQKRAEEEIRKLHEELEQRVVQRTAQLELVNAELKKEIAERKQAEEALTYRLKFENLIAEISSDFTHRAANQFDQGITRALDEVGHFVEVDRSYVVLFSGHSQEMSITHEWCADGVEPKIYGGGHFPMPRLPWLRDQLDQLDPVRIAALTDLPPEAEQEKRYFEAERTKSCVIVPLVCGGVLKGFVGFDALRSERSWANEMVGLLWTASQSLANALQNKWAKETRLALETQLYHAQQLASIGYLAAGIAHEINTSTQFVGDNTRFLRDVFGDLIKRIEGLERVAATARGGRVDQNLLDEIEQARSSADIGYLRAEIPKAIEQSLEGIQRVSKIVRAMKEFSHPDMAEKAAVNLNRAIETTVAVARNEWKYVAEMNLDLDPTLPMIVCIPGDINQVILNLIVNAADAIRDKVGDGATGKGMITISTKSDGDAVEIRVADTGTGIPEKYRPRMFEPFFTTKIAAKGTGQGLAIAYNVVSKKHGGTIHFETEVGQGTTFIIRLPRCET